MSRAQIITANLHCLVLLASGMSLILPAFRVVGAQLDQPVRQSSGTHLSRSTDSTCLSCHRELTEYYPLTAHARTSQPASAKSILGPLSNGRQVLTITDPRTANDRPSLIFEMGQDGDHFFQRAVRGLPGQMDEHKEPIDEVIGSGIRGQTYLYWHGDQLYELPVSYWRDGDRWINSPGFPDGSAEFSRPVTARCLECHATMVQPKSMSITDNRFVRTTLEHGIGCARCHGPVTAHVAAERKAAEKGALKDDNSRILNPARFSRQQQVELCALCHSGRRDQVMPAFSYTAGEPLDSFFEEVPVHNSASPDVHGNQVGLLRRSKCYLNSPEMTCSTCHQMHAPEKEAYTYSSRCLSCHTVETCGIYPKLGHKIANDCIRCHMPMQLTNSIVSQTAGETIHPTIRTHWIGIYPALNQ